MFLCSNKSSTDKIEQKCHWPVLSSFHTLTFSMIICCHGFLYGRCTDCFNSSRCCINGCQKGSKNVQQSWYSGMIITWCTCFFYTFMNFCQSQYTCKYALLLMFSNSHVWCAYTKIHKPLWVIPLFSNVTIIDYYSVWELPRKDSSQFFFLRKNVYIVVLKYTLCHYYILHGFWAILWHNSSPTSLGCLKSLFCWISRLPLVGIGV